MSSNCLKEQLAQDFPQWTKGYADGRAEAADEIERLRNERDGYKAGFNLKSAEVAKLCLRVAQLEESNRIYVEDAKRDEQTNADLRSQLVSAHESFRKIRTSYCGYAITKSEQYPEVLADFWKEIQRMDKIARSALTDDLGNRDV